MSGDIRKLPIVKKELLPLHTSFYLLDGPTFIYFNHGSVPHKLYLNDKHGKEVAANLPATRISNVGVYGNAIYFEARSKIYKAECTPQGSIEVSFVRNQIESEWIGLACTNTTTDGKIYVYRLCDDPDRDRILVSDYELKWNGETVKGVHRGRAIYITLPSTDNRDVPPIVKRYNKELIVVEGHCTSVFTQDSSPFCYFMTYWMHYLHVLDTRTMKFLPAVEFNDVRIIWYIANVTNTGTIAMNCTHSHGQDYAVFAKLPVGYFHPTDAVSVEMPSLNNGEMESFRLLMDARSARHAHYEASRASLQKELEELMVNLRDVRSSTRREAGNGREDQEMPEDIRILPITKKVLLPENTDIFLVDGPTIFYHYHGTKPHKLYIHDAQGKEVAAELPRDIIFSVGAYGNAIYFETGSKIYKAMCTPHGSIAVSYLRSQFGRIDLDTSGVVATSTTNTDDGKTYVCRMCDDPSRDGILVSDDELRGKYAKGVHRGRAIYIILRNISPVVRKYNNEFILVEGHFRSVYTQDASPFCYFTLSKLHVLDTRTMHFLPAVKFNDVNLIWYITNITNSGTIAMKGEFGRNQNYSVLAKLPAEYFGQTDAVSMKRPSQGNEAKVSSSTATSGYVSSNNGQSLRNSYDFIMSKLGELAVSKKSVMEQIESLNTSISMGFEGLADTANAHNREITEFDSEFLKKFKPVKILGIGGFGCVFESENLVDKCKYAVKRITLRGSEEFVNEAFAEVCTLASLKHEGIVGYNCSWIEKPPPRWQNRSDASMLESVKCTKSQMESLKALCNSDDCTFLYLQMELCSLTLQEFLHFDTDRDIRKAKRFFEQIVSAVKYLHDKKKIHRDLKPSNILFSNDDSQRIKICDLGLVADRAVRNGQEVDRTRTVAGTEIYMAPEQFGKRYSSKVDIYSLGLILTELCAKMTYDKMNEVFINYRIGRPNRILDHLPVAAHLVSQMTNLDPAKRPTCEEILLHDFIASRTERAADVIRF